MCCMGFPRILVVSSSGVAYTILTCISHSLFSPIMCIIFLLAHSSHSSFFQSYSAWYGRRSASAIIFVANVGIYYTSCSIIPFGSLTVPLAIADSVVSFLI